MDNPQEKSSSRFLDRYKAYVNHLSALAEDKWSKSKDRAHVKGYVNKMKTGRTLVGTAMCIDLLQPAAMLIC